MLLDHFLPDVSSLACKTLTITPTEITVRMVADSPSALCPDCGQVSHRAHSHYPRTLSDLPWCGIPFRLHLQVRRFFCDNPTCRRKIFTERLGGLATSHARKSIRLLQALRCIGFECGGECGARVAAALGMPASADTILDLIRQAPPPLEITPQVLGVDDWAWRKGQRYGTILCNLERHRPVDLLPERSAETFSAWLLAHPGVQIITRDRAGYYAQGAAQGAPEAQQVADRFHLIHNLHDALKRMLDKHPAHLREAVKSLIPQASSATSPAPVVSLPLAPPLAEPTPSRRRELYRQVRQLHTQGISYRKIAKQLSLDRGTVQRFVQAEEFPQRAEHRHIKPIDKYAPILAQRWTDGCRNARQLTLELKREGFTGSYYMVRRYLLPWRLDVQGSIPIMPTPRIRRPSPRAVAWMMLKDEPEREEEDQHLLEAMWQCWPEVKQVGELALEFRHLLRDRQLPMLEGWIERACAAGISAELTAFAKGLKQDYEAVKAAFRVEWSNGQVEGQVNRLKLIKRQMYGRAGFELLRQRVLNAG